MVDPPEEDEHEREERARALRPGDHMAPATAVKKRRLLRKWMPCRGLFLAFDLFDYYGPIWALNSWVRRFALLLVTPLCVSLLPVARTIAFTLPPPGMRILTHKHTHARARACAVTFPHTLTSCIAHFVSPRSAVENRRSSCWD